MKSILAKSIPLLFLISFLLFASCDRLKIDPEPECNLVGVDLGRDELIYDGPGYRNLRFNPNIADEFVFVKGNFWISDYASIWKYNISTGESEMITDGIYKGTYLDWSTTDWILFSGNDFQLWKIKSNGDSLTQLKSSLSLAGTWSPDGRRIFLSHLGTSVLVDEEGSITDSLDIEANFRYPRWSPNGKWIASFEFKNQFSNLILFNIHAGEIRNVSYDHGMVLGSNIISWLPDSKKLVYCSAEEGVYTFDLDTEEFVQIRKGCGHYSSTSYRYVTASPDGDKVVLSYVTYKRKSRWKVKVTHNIIMMDIDGTNAEILLSSD